MRIWPEKTVDQEFADLAAAGHFGALNDRQFSYLRGQGYTGALADMMFQWRVGGGAGPAILGNSDTIVSGGVTWTLSAPVDYGVTVDGVPWIIVPPGGVNVTARSPAATTESALAVNGTMKNPQRLQQGWDARLATYSAGLNQAFPISVTAGDIIVGQIHVPIASATPLRKGVSASYSGLICTSGGYPANTFAPALIGWSGRGTPQAYSMNVDAAVAALPSYSLSGIANPAVTTVISQIDRLEIGPAVTPSTVDTVGYETLLTNGLGDGSSNYGQLVARWIGAAGLHLIGDVATTAQKKTLLTALIRHGIQWYDTAAGAGSVTVADGGHWQFQLIPIAMALHYLGRGAQVDTLSTVWPGNFFGQAFTYDSTRLANLAPHSSLTLPMVSRRRSITAVSGNDITFGTDRTGGVGDTPRSSFIGLELVRESDGASALITAMRANTTIAGTDDSTSIGSGVNTKGFTIAAQPTPAFAVSDVVYLRRTETIYLDDTDWRAFNADWSINPSFDQVYRGLNFWSDDVLTLRALGIWRSSWDAIERYTALANRANDPSSARDYPTHHDTAGGQAFAQGFWNNHAATVLGSYPVVLANVAITGTPSVGQTLTATPATVAPAGTTRAYQWYRGASAISGATSSTYVVQFADIGNNISVWETITNANGSQVSRSATVAVTYSVNAVNFNGSTRANDNAVSGSAATTQGAFVFSFRYATTYAAGTVFNALTAAGTTQVEVGTPLDTGATPPTTQGRVGVTLRNAANVVIGSLVSANGEFLVGSYYTCAISFNTATQTWVWRKRIDGGAWVTVTPATATLTLNAQVGAIGRFWLGALAAGGGTNLANGMDLADLWVGIGQLPDFTNASVLASFLPTVSKGANGSLPTGTAPEFFFSGDTGTFHTNDGTGGGLTLTGTLTTASAMPT